MAGIPERACGSSVATVPAARPLRGCAHAARPWLLGGALLGLALQGCGATPVDAAAGGEQAGGTEAVAGVAADPAGGDRLFSGEALAGEGCVLLGVDEVASLAGIGAGGISTSPAMDCLFMWEGGGVALTRPSVHRSVEQAREQYAGFTQDLTADEMRAGVADLGKRLDAKAAAGEITAKQAATGAALAGSQSGRDVRNTDVPGVGDEASHDGNRIKVRVGNVIFDVAADRDDAFDLGLSKAVAARAVHNLQQRSAL